MGNDHAKLQSLQVLRFAAAALVVGTHAVTWGARNLAGQPLGRYDGLGACGVDIFFVLSGVIIYETAFARERQRPGEFLRRRLTRIAPIYYLVTLALLPLAGGQDAPRSVAGILTTISFWPAWGKIVPPMLGVGWSLCFEMLFYAGAAAVLADRRALWAIIAAFPALWLARDATGWPVFQFLGNPIILEFAAGVFIAAVWRKPPPGPVGVLLILIGMLWLLVFVPPPDFAYFKWTMTGTASVIRLVLWGIPAVMLLIGALSLEPYCKGRWVRWLVYGGDASYAIYLVHLPLVATASRLMREMGLVIPFSLAVPLFMALGIGAGVLVYQYVERPLLRRLRSVQWGGHQPRRVGVSQ